MLLQDGNSRPGGSRQHFRLHVEGWPGALLGIVIGAVAIVLVVVFSLVVLPVLLVGGIAGGGYLWWRTRKLRSVLREEQVRRRSMREREVEGELLRVDELDPPERGVGSNPPGSARDP